MNIMVGCIKFSNFVFVGTIYLLSLPSLFR